VASRLRDYGIEEDHLDEPGFERVGANPDGAGCKVLQVGVRVDELDNVFPGNHGRQYTPASTSEH
jgi:hypothetical protein